MKRRDLLGSWWALFAAGPPPVDAVGDKQPISKDSTVSEASEFARLEGGHAMQRPSTEPTQKAGSQPVPSQ
jgi:hypothetical protein